MTLIYETKFERTLDLIVARLAKAKGSTVEVWTFDDEASRRAAEAKLATLDVRARFRSAYKPLLHFFLEEVEIETLATIHVLYPVHAACSEHRFRSETYPLAALVGDARLTFEAGTQSDFFYRVMLKHKDGTIRTHSIFAPNRVHVDCIGARHVSPTGWVRIGDEEAGERLETEYEALFEAAIQAVISHQWREQEPYFEELNVAVSLPIEDRRLPVGEEAISLREAMHEELYFSLLEYFQMKSGHELGDFSARPGQIVPEVRYASSAPALKIETRPLTQTEAVSEFTPLKRAEAPISTAQLKAELIEIGGEAFEARSRSGRPVMARYIKGVDRPVILSAGQHANETTAIVGALRAARDLAARPGAHFVISPLESPDAYHLHWRLRKENPRYHHHAARYTAFGDDIGHRTKEPLFEKEIRREAERRSGAKLHLNLHGYSSHEWTRPLSGYFPRLFENWAVPKGFCLLMHHHTDWADAAEWLIDKVTARLARLPGLVEFNRSQISLFEMHVGGTNFRMTNGIPCIVWSDEDRYTIPLTFISEYPDETIYGRAFVVGHDAQTEFVLAAYEAYQQMPLA